MIWSKTIYDILRLVILNFLDRVDQYEVVHEANWKTILTTEFKYLTYFQLNGLNYEYFIVLKVHLDKQSVI